MDERKCSRDVEVGVLIGPRTCAGVLDHSYLVAASGDDLDSRIGRSQHGPDICEIELDICIHDDAARTDELLIVAEFDTLTAGERQLVAAKTNFAVCKINSCSGRHVDCRVVVQQYISNVSHPRTGRRDPDRAVSVDTGACDANPLVEVEVARCQRSGQLQCGAASDVHGRVVKVVRSSVAERSRHGSVNDASVDDPHPRVVRAGGRERPVRRARLGAGSSALNDDGRGRRHVRERQRAVHHDFG